MENCVFCKIIAGDIPTNFVAKEVDVVAFYDISPLAQTHILIAPKEHIASFLEIKDTHSELLGKMIKLAQNLILKNNLEPAYKIAFNGGKYQHVPHLHWHLLGG